jgi:hypothetical protein
MQFLKIYLFLGLVLGGRVKRIMQTVKKCIPGKPNFFIMT